MFIVFSTATIVTLYYKTSLVHQWVTQNGEEEQDSEWRVGKELQGESVMGTSLKGLIEHTVENRHEPTVGLRQNSNRGLR
jgi:hypothetical protein